MDLYLHTNGHAHGPYPEADARNRWSAGELPVDTLSWRIGEPRWTYLGRRWAVPATRRWTGIGSVLAWTGVLALLGLLYGIGDELPVAWRTFASTATLVAACVATASIGLALRARMMRRQTGRMGAGTVSAMHVLIFAGIISAFVLVQRRADDAVRATFGNAAMRVSSDGKMLSIEGGIGARFVDDLQAALARAPGIERATVHSPGGLVDDAMEAGRLLAARGVAVRVERQCASACVLLWASSNTPEMTADGRLGLHRTETTGEIPAAWRRLALQRSDQAERAVLTARGFDEALLQLRARTEPGDMAWVDAARLLDAGVAMKLVDEEGRALDVMTARMLAVIDAVADDDPLLPLYRSTMAMPRLRDAHAEALHDALAAEDAHALPLATDALAMAARQEGVGFAPDEAVAAWGRARAELLAHAITRGNTTMCTHVMFADAVPPQPDYAAMHVRGLARLIDALPPGDGASARRLGDARPLRAIAQAAYAEVALRHGLDGPPTRWPVLQQCAFVRTLYERASRLPAAKAAVAIAAMEGDMTGIL